MLGESVYPFFYDITALLMGCIVITVQHVYREMNSGLAPTYITEHSEDFLWIDTEEAF